MTEPQHEELNHFFVHVFNQILACEEQALNRVGAQDLAVKELHVLEAVSDLAVENRNTMTQIADALAIRVSSLTTAVNTLVRKGYLKRGGEPGDRRVIRVWLTPKGEEANRLHAQFHAKMVEEAASGLEAGELDTLLRSLRPLDHFFHDMSRHNQYKQKEAHHGSL